VGGLHSLMGNSLIGSSNRLLITNMPLSLPIVTPVSHEQRRQQELPKVQPSDFAQAHDRPTQQRFHSHLPGLWVIVCVRACVRACMYVCMYVCMCVRACVFLS